MISCLLKKQSYDLTRHVARMIQLRNPSTVLIGKSLKK